MDLFSIYMPNLAAKLVSLGFPLIQTKPNLKNPKYMVYQFENTIDFQIALQKLLK